MSSLFSAFQYSWANRQDAPLVVTSQATLCFADVDERASSIATALRSVARAAPGDVLMAVVHKSVDALALYLACLRCGVVFLPANPAYTASELQHIVEDAAPAILVCDPTATELGEQLRRHSPSLRQVLTLGRDGRGSLAQAAQDAAPCTDVEDCAESAPAALLYTSGTTGTPKGVPLSHGNLLSNARALVQAWGFNEQDRLVHALPIFHVHGLFVALHCVLLAGASMRYLERFDAAVVRNALTGASVLMGVPTYYSRLLALEDFTREHCASIRLFISGSAPLTEKLFKAFEQRTGQRILERYGMTETGMIASNPLCGERVPGTVGYPLPGVHLRITDEQGMPVRAGQTGMVEVSGPGVFSAYRNRPEVNAREFTSDGWFRTGDLGWLAADGRLTLAGRARDLIISGGYNIYPAEVESCLDTLPGVQESAVIGVPHHDLGEAVVAVLVPSDGPTPPTAEDLAAQLASRLARYKQPRHLEFTDTLPRNTMGKVRKDLLRERLQGLFAEHGH